MTYQLAADTADPGGNSKNFRSKGGESQLLINEALSILDSLGVQFYPSGRRNECMAMAFIAVADVRRPGGWQDAKDLGSGHSLTTREIIAFCNEHLEENKSLGSYDDIRRKDLKPLKVADIVAQSSPESAHNSPQRGWGVSEYFGDLVRSFGSKDWDENLKTALDGYETLRERLSAEREMNQISVKVKDGVEIKFGPGEHNALQKAVVEEFLPRYGFQAEVLYIADAVDRGLYQDEARLNELGVFELRHEELPDVIAYSQEKDWLYVIEAVTSSGPVDPYRHAQISSLLKGISCSGVVYVTAFPDRYKPFRTFLPEISWETEVWVASDPDHLIHFDGERFLGPYVG